jgi:hypothetical protein
VHKRFLLTKNEEFNIKGEEVKIKQNEGLKIKEDEEVKINQLVERGYELMIKSFIDLQKFEIISEKELSLFLNNKNTDGQLILPHALNGFHKSELTMIFFYPHFKEEFKKGSSNTLQMAGLLKCKFIFGIPFLVLKFLKENNLAHCNNHTIPISFDIS